MTDVLERRLPALPVLWDDGYSWMDQLTEWAVVPNWGLDGWDLGEWPYVIVATCSVRPHGPYGVVTYCESDLEVQAFATHEERIAAIDRIAEFYWRLKDEGPPELPDTGPLRPEHCGPFSWKRLDGSRG